MDIEYITPSIHLYITPSIHPTCLLVTAAERLPLPAAGQFPADPHIGWVSEWYSDGSNGCWVSEWVMVVMVMMVVMAVEWVSDGNDGGEWYSDGSDGSEWYSDGSEWW